jgi:hypothetical protein
MATSEDNSRPVSLHLDRDADGSNRLTTLLSSTAPLGGEFLIRIDSEKWFSELLPLRHKSSVIIPEFDHGVSATVWIYNGFGTLLVAPLPVSIGSVRGVHLAPPEKHVTQQPNNFVRYVFFAFGTIAFGSWLAFRLTTSTINGPMTNQRTHIPANSSYVRCANINDCFRDTMNSMSKYDTESVRNIAKKVDTFEKPARGNASLARQLNANGLRASNDNDFAEAAAFFESAYREDPSDQEIAANLGYARIKTRDLEGANRALMAALQLNPRRSSTWLPLAELAARRDQNTGDAVNALLVAFEWSNKEKAIDSFRNQANIETHPQFRAAYQQALDQAIKLRANAIAGMEDGLVGALRYDKKTSKRAVNSGVAIQAYMREGFVSRGPNRRAQSIDYYLVNRATKFMGHDLVMIDEEYLAAGEACCANPGVGVTVRLNGPATNLEKFGTDNRCSFLSNVNFQHKLGAVGIKNTALPGDYASLSCREKDANRL